MKCKCKENIEFLFGNEYIEIYKCFKCGRILECNVELFNDETWYNVEEHNSEMIKL